jgi:predicted RNA-binding protein (virulence factor B family)
MPVTDVIRDTGTDRPDVVDTGIPRDVIVPTDDGSTVAPECRRFLLEEQLSAMEAPIAP